MAFDGITTFAICSELRQRLQGGRIDKIYQPEADEAVLSVRSLGQNLRLLLTCQASHPRLHITEKKPENPLSPPMFCMLFRKHFAGGKITEIAQIEFDRIVEISVEVFNEMGDLCTKKIILEIMGKHSNLILTDENGRIIDAMRHVTEQMSKFRTVLPGLPYTHSRHNDKANPLLVSDEASLFNLLEKCGTVLSKSLYQALNGLCPVSAREICYRAGVSDKAPPTDLPPAARQSLFVSFRQLLSSMQDQAFTYRIYRDGDAPSEFSVLPYFSLGSAPFQEYETLSALLDVFYAKQDVRNKIQQKSQDLHKLIQTNLERARKKAGLQEQQMADTKGRELDRIYGELLTANIYQLKKGMTSVSVSNFYEEDAPSVTIPLDSNLGPSQNAQRYFNRYNKQKRTEAALTQQLEQTHEEIAYLDSILGALELADCEKDLEDIRLELHETGYIRKTRKSKKNLSTSKPLEFRTSEGLRVLIGKNNIQNDMLTFRISSPYDYWFHVKDIPGSHTILFCAGLEFDKDYTMASLAEAASLAAAHSKASTGSNVPVDYALRKYVKKPAGAKPGFVIYTHQQTLYGTPSCGCFNYPPAKPRPPSFRPWRPT